MKYNRTTHDFRSLYGAATAAVTLVACFNSDTPVETQIIESSGSTAVVDFTTSGSGSQGGGSTPSASTEADPTKTVCDPFANNPNHPGAGYDLGVVGKMAYLSSEMPRYSSARDYFKYGHLIDATMFFTNISVPTRAFDLGFTTQSGKTLTNQNGNTLYEYFGLQLETELQLAPSDPDGLYQFALLSDDGAVMDMDLGSGYTNIINNDGVHATRMGCATQAVYMDHTRTIPTRIYYYQGPRYHIALNLIWRRWTGSASDTSCGTSGNSLFWNSSVVPSAPTTTFQNILNRGWSVVSASHYALPRQITSNPCTSNTPQEPARATIASATPAAGSSSNTTTASFQLSSNYSDATFECSLDGGTRAACSASVSYTGITQGTHTFQAWAIHSSAPSDTTAATVSWTVDLTAPNPTGITSSSTSDSITISWNTSEASIGQISWGVTTDTPLVTAWEATYGNTHTVTLSGLDPDTAYFFRVTVKDSAGNSFTSNRMGLLTQP